MTETWDGAINFSSYDQVEIFGNYRSAAEVEAYRSERLAFGWKIAEFVLGATQIARPADVVEIGAGSSALLYAMDLHGALKHGLAIELSASRHQFAEQWRQDKNFRNVVNRHGDFATAAPEPGSADLFLCMDNTFSYLGPENDAYPRRLAGLAATTLKPGGYLVIDTVNQEKLVATMRDDERRLWTELPDTNAFKFALYRQSLNREQNLIRSESIYIRRDGSERRKTEIETAHTRGAVESLLSAASFADFRSYGGYDASPYDPTQSGRLIVLARKPAI